MEYGGILLGRTMASHPVKTAERLRFGEGFELDARAYELRRSGRVLKLERIPMELLLFLMEERGHLVSRDRIVERIWGKGVFLDTDNSINAAVRKIRRVLKDDPEQPRFVQTITGRGYRFIAPVEEAGAPAIERLTQSAPANDALPGASRIRARLGLALLLLTVVGTASAPWLVARVRPAAGAAPSLRSIAVLPLDNLSGDSSQDYFVDGMTDALTTDLAKVSSLRVISRTSAMRYRGTKKGMPEIAGELQVDGVVEGSVMRSGNRVRITAQLIHGPTDRHLWAETYERDLDDVLRLQSEVAQAIALQVRAQLTPQQQVRLGSASTVNPEAYDAYLRGRYYMTAAGSTLQPLNTAKKYYEESIRKDPAFALAYAGLADSYVGLASFRYLSPERAYRSAKEALGKALELDGNLGEAHTTLALLSWRHEWDWANAEREFDQAIALAASYDCSRASYGSYLAWKGRRAEALAETTRGRELNPGSSFAVQESAVYFQLRDYAGLVDASRRGVASDPNEWLEHHFLGVGLEGLGKRLEAIPEYRKAVEMSHGDQDAVAALAHGYAADGRRAEAETMLRGLERNASDGYVSPYLIATIYAGLGNKDKAFELLEKACRERCWDIPWQIKADVRIDNLRSDPRFKAVLRRVGLAQ
jgi:TolB-like protein/DNA-binding winged helix-turn-helix (wHTH) protein